MEFPADAAWLINEQQNAGPEHLDAAYVRGYNRKAQVDPTADIHALQQLGLSPQSTVIDFGAGTGVFAQAIATHCQSVIAVDPSPAMNAYLKEQIAQSDLSNVTVVHGGLLSYQHKGEPVDFIFTRNTLHHLPDFWKMLALTRMHELLAPGGILRVHDLIYDFPATETTAQLNRWFASAVDDAAVGWTAEELAEHVRTEHSTFRWLFEAMLTRAGFTILECVYQRNVYGAYSCRA